MVLRLLVLLLLAALVMVGCDSGQEEEEVSIFTIADDSTVSKTGKTGVEVTKPSPASETGEGGTTTTFKVRLIGEPLAAVTLTLTSDNTSEGTVSPGSLSFAPNAWQTYQTVTATGVDDFAADGSQTYKINFSVTSDDLKYASLTIAPLALINRDNETAGVLITPATPTPTSENGSISSFTVKLNAMPLAAVSFSLTSNNTNEGKLLNPDNTTTDNLNLAFGSDNWSTVQTVRVKGIDDVYVDGTQSYKVQLSKTSSTSTPYDNLILGSVSLSNTDNDTVSVVITAASPDNITAENGSDNATFTVKLGSAAHRDNRSIAVKLTSSDPSEGMPVPASLTFTAANFSTPQTVMVAGVDDAIRDDNVTYRIDVSISGTGTGYDGFTDNRSFLSIDNESAEGVTLSGTALTLNEDNGTATFTARLTTEPTASVVLPLGIDNATLATVSPSYLLFNSVNWKTSQTVTVRGINNFIDHPTNPTTKIRLSPINSADAKYSAFVPDNVTATFTDDDTAGLTVTGTDNTSGENGDNATLTVKLNTQPLASVTLAVTDNDSTEVTRSPATLTFDNTTWATAQTVMVPGKNDELLDGTQSVKLTVAVQSTTDVQYSALSAINHNLQNLDNDTAGILVVITDNASSESGDNATLTVRLASRPDNTTTNKLVTLTLASLDLDEGTVSPARLVLGTDNGTTPQTITVTGQNDFMIDGTQQVRLNITVDNASTTQAEYHPLSAAATVYNTDDDVAGFKIAVVDNTTSESGGTGSVKVRLDTQPDNVTGQIVVLHVTTAQVMDRYGNTRKEVSFSPERLVFSGKQGESGRTFWSDNATVTLTGLNDDLDDGDKSVLVTVQVFRSSDASSLVEQWTTETNYNTVTPREFTIVNSDDETSGFVVSAISDNTTEAGGTAQFTVRLSSQPEGAVTLSLRSDNTTEGRVTPDNLSFSNTNWNLSQTVVVTGQDDASADGDISYQIRFDNSTSSDPNYNNKALAAISLKNLDNEQARYAGFTISEATGTVSESGGGQAVITVALAKKPTADVTIPVSVDDATEGKLYSVGGYTNRDNLTFSATNWNAVQEIRVTGVNDNLSDGNQPFKVVLGSTVSSDTAYHTQNPSDVYVTNVDDDSAGVLVSTISGATSESGGTALFTIRLTSQPDDGDNSTSPDTVLLHFVSSKLTEGKVSPDNLSFTPGNWNAERTVTVTGVNDNASDGDQAYTIKVTMDNATKALGYKDLDPPDVLVTNKDDETAGFVVGTPSGPTSESGGSATFLVRLRSQPSNTVTIALSSEKTTEGKVNPDNLSFTTANWNADQVVTVTGVNDNVSDGDQGFRIILAEDNATQDTNYRSLNPPDVVLVNADDDTAGFFVSAVSGDTDEDGTPASFMVRLRSQPASGVTLYTESTDSTEGKATPTSLAFTTGNWNSWKTVTITGQPDNLSDGDQTYAVRLLPDNTSSDVGYRLLDPPDVTLRNLDLASGGYVLSAISGNTDENGGEANFTIRLRSKPTASVILTLASSKVAEGTIKSVGGSTSNTDNVTFNTVNWSSAVSVVVKGVADNVSDGDQSYAIRIGSDNATVDLRYRNLEPPDVSLRNRDAGAGFFVSTVSGSTSEVGGSAVFSVRLSSKPTANVAVGLKSSNTSEGKVSGAVSNTKTLTFTSTNWNAEQLVTLLGVDDNVSDGDQGYRILLSPDNVTADLNYRHLDPPDVMVSNVDDESAGFTMTINSYTSESGVISTIKLKLNSQPTAGVTIGVASSKPTEGKITSISSGGTDNVSFTTSDWNSYKSILITGQDDNVSDGDQAYIVELTADTTTSDFRYRNRDPADVQLINLDNDVAGFFVSAVSGDTSEVGGT